MRKISTCDSADTRKISTCDSADMRDIFTCDSADTRKIFTCDSADTRKIFTCDSEDSDVNEKDGDSGSCLMSGELSNLCSCFNTFSGKIPNK